MEIKQEEIAAQFDPCPRPDPFKRYSKAKALGLIFSGLVIFIIATIGFTRSLRAPKASADYGDEKIMGCNDTPAFYTHDPATGKAVDEIHLCIGDKHHLFWNAKRFTEPDGPVGPESAEIAYKYLMEKKQAAELAAKAAKKH